MSYKILFRRGTSTEWSTANPILAYGEVGAESGDAPQLKVGDGVTPWNDLPYAGSGIGVLPGGEAGAILTKSSAENYDTDWVTREDLADDIMFAGRFDRKVAYDVRDFGAYSDGVVDDTTAVQNAINAAYNAGGGLVRIPAGITLISSSIIPRTNVVIKGAGVDATTIRVANNANCAAFQTNNFTTLDAGDTDGGPSSFAILDLTIDGNKLFNTTSSGIKIYGYGFRLAHLRIIDCVNYGLYSKWGTSTAEINAHDMMSTVEDVHVHDCGGDGIAWNGPHHTVFINTYVYRNDRGFVFDLNGNDCTLVACNGYGADQVWAFYLNTANLNLIGCIAEGAGTSNAIGGQVYLGSTGTIMSGCTVSGGGSGSPANNVRGIVIGGATTASGYNINARFANCDAGSIIFVNDGGGVIGGTVIQTSGAVQAGTTHAYTVLNLYVSGGATYQQPNIGPMVETSSSFTLSKTHGSRFVRCTNNSRITVTIPTDATEDLPDGYMTTLYSEGLGGLTMATPGITLTGATPNKTIIRNQTMTLLKTTEANTWTILGGDVPSEANMGAFTIDPKDATNDAALSSNNQARYVRLKGTHMAATGMWINVGTQSGNICVAIYPNNGFPGTAARPSGDRKATTGSISCPASGLNFVTFTAPVDIEDGDWFCLAADNTTATFSRATMIISGAGVAYQQATAFPCPSTVGTLTGSTSAFYGSSV